MTGRTLPDCSGWLQLIEHGRNIAGRASKETARAARHEESISAASKRSGAHRLLCQGVLPALSEAAAPVAPSLLPRCRRCGCTAACAQDAGPLQHLMLGQRRTRRASENTTSSQPAGAPPLPHQGRRGRCPRPRRQRERTRTRAASLRPPAAAQRRPVARPRRARGRHSTACSSSCSASCTVLLRARRILFAVSSASSSSL